MAQRVLRRPRQISRPAAVNDRLCTCTSTLAESEVWDTRANAPTSRSGPCWQFAILATLIVFGELDHGTVSYCLPCDRTDRSRSGFWRNCRLVRGSGEDPVRRLPRFGRTVLLRRRDAQATILELTRSPATNDRPRRLAATPRSPVRSRPAHSGLVYFTWNRVGLARSESIRLRNVER